eukprot:GCRY01004834.1.p1 GENE.GCRY01004834.1~~GCRY01004834.1.p1  ORF type:complete len:219 (-),score=37.23 GCRY01004834.1:73-654(-)
MPQLNVAVFCGSRHGANESYTHAAIALGEAIAHRQHTLVYGGGSVGLMGSLAHAVDDGGARVVGVIPGVLAPAERSGVTVGEQIVATSMNERKAAICQMSHCFIALPGGYGTLDELFEVLTNSQLDIDRKPIGILNIEGYYDGIIEWVRNAAKEAFVSPEHTELFVVDADPVALLDKLEAAIKGLPAAVLPEE